MDIKPRFPRVPTLTGVLLAVVMAHAQQPDAGPTSKAKSTAAGNIEVLSDTKGVDFGPYLSEMLKTVRANWYNFIPEEARPPQLMPGVTSIEFAILPNGNVAGMRIVHPSGSVPLDRAAWGGITKGNPYPRLPHEFTGPFLALRFHFYYNPEKLPPDQRPAPKPGQAETQKPQPN